MKTCTRCQRAVLSGGLCATHYYSKDEKAKRLAKRHAPRSCVSCGTDLTGRSPAAIYCSDKCKAAGWAVAERQVSVARRTGRPCEECGNVIASLAGRAKTCSSACSIARVNRLRQARRRVEWEATSPTCAHCGEVNDRRIGTLYCSFKCKQRAAAVRNQAIQLKRYRERTYGVTPERYAELLESQDNRCAICRTDTPNGKGSWHIDHDHATGKVRGLLCHHCNVMLGNAKDDPAILRAAVAYLT